MFNRLSSVYSTVIISLLIVLGNVGGSFAGDENLNSLLPPATFLENWKWEEAPLFYEPENLFEYINGSAELYLSYDFKKLITVAFIDSAERTIVIDIYDMRTPLNAFGVYSVYRNPGNQFESIGTEAVVSDYHIRFYKSRYVVDLNASAMTDEIQQNLRKLAQAIASKIEDIGTDITELKLLPNENMIPKTLKYISSGLLGHKFLPRGPEAAYKAGDQTVKGFIAICKSPTEAKKAYQSYLNYLRNNGKSTADQPDLGEAAFSAEIPYHQHGLICRHGRFIIGAIDLTNVKNGKKLVRMILSKILNSDFAE